MKTVRPRPAARHALESYLYEIDVTPLLTADDEKVLAYRIAEGDAEARDQLVRANLRLVVSLARRYVGKGLPLEDLIAEGNMGLMRAAEGFDPTAGTRFATYAAYWIKQSIRRAVGRDGPTVRLPQYMWTLLGRWQATAGALRRELGRDGTEDEVNARVGLTAKQVRALRMAIRVLASGQVADDEDGGRAVEQIAAGDKACPVEAVAGAELVREMMASLDTLSEREVTILRLRFGLGGAEPITLKEVGEQLGYTRERVRQIERAALEKLRQHVAA